MAQPKERFQAVQALRFLCFIIVFWVHSPIDNLIQVKGPWVLVIFFMLSGFMMVYSYADRELPRGLVAGVKYGYKHIGKLYPLHVETTLLQLCMYVPAAYSYCVLTGMDMTWQQILVKHLPPLAAHLALLQDWVPDFQNYIFGLNGPSWFLSAMVFCYALFPSVMRLLKKLKTTGNVLAVCLGLSVASGILTHVLGVNIGYCDDSDFVRWLTQNCPVVRFIDFFMGCAMGWLFLEYRRKKAEYPGCFDQKPVSAAKWTVIEALAFLLILVEELYPRFLGDDSFCMIMKECRAILPVLMSWPVIMVCVLNRGYITRALCWKPLVYLGNISMYTYLIHYIFTQAWSMKMFAEGWENPMTDSDIVVVTIVEFILTILCSIGYDRLRKSRAKKKLAARAA